MLRVAWQAKPLGQMGLCVQGLCACRPATAAFWASARHMGACRWRGRSRLHPRTTQACPLFSLPLHSIMISAAPTRSGAACLRAGRTNSPAGAS